jgi:DNA-binding transcriptional LysR family regulator
MSTRWPAIADHLEKLPYFVAVARAGALQKAARDLRVAQPSLTRAMRLLEDSLGATLLQRSRKGVTLTPAGTEFQRFAESLLTSLAQVERRVKDLAGDAASGEVRIGTHELLVREFWPALVREVQKAMPRLNLTLFTHASVSELVRRVNAGELDLIVAVECPAMDGLARREVRHDSYGLYASGAFCKEHGLNAARRLTPEQFAMLPLIYAHEVIAGPRTKLVDALRAVGIDRPSLFPVGSLESVTSLTESGLGLGLLPRLTVQKHKTTRLKELQFTWPGASKNLLGVHRFFVATTSLGMGEARITDLMERSVRILTM